MTDLSNEALDALVALDEVYDTMMDVERNPCGAWQAIHSIATTITALRAREAAIVAAAFEVLCNVLYCCDTEAQAIADRISGPRGERNRCPDGVQVLEDAETIIRAAAALVTPSDATAALEAIKRGERNKARLDIATEYYFAMTKFIDGTRDERAAAVAAIGREKDKPEDVE